MGAFLGDKRALHREGFVLAQSRFSLLLAIALFYTNSASFAIGAFGRRKNAEPLDLGDIYDTLWLSSQQDEFVP